MNPLRCEKFLLHAWLLEEPLIIGPQARVPTRKTEDADVRRDRTDTADIGRRQRRIELLCARSALLKYFPAFGADLIWY